MRKTGGQKDEGNKGRQKDGQTNGRVKGGADKRRGDTITELC